MARVRLMCAAAVALLAGGGWFATPASAAAASQPLSAVLAAGTATVGSSSAVRMELQGARVAGSAPPPIVGTGAFDFANSRGVIDLEVPAPGGATALHRTLFLPTVVYVRPPSPRASSLPAGKNWIVATLNQTESTSTNFPQFVLQEEGLSPLLEIQQLVWGAVSAKAIAPRRVGPDSAPGYQVRVDLRRAASQAVRTNAALTLAIQTEINGLGGTTTAPKSSVISEKVWVAHGKIAAVQLSPPGAGIGLTTTTLSRYGIRVAIHVPPPSSVTDIASLTPAGEQESGPESDVA